MVLEERFLEKRNSGHLYAAALTAAAVVLAVRALYGFCWSDESFYLTFAQRLWNGQKLILDEWHPVQFYSVLFYPILSLYHALFGNRGIYLFAREVYVAVAWGTALLLFYTLNAGILLGYILLKLISLPLMRGLCGAAGELADAARGICYEHDPMRGAWLLKKNCAQESAMPSIVRT